MKFSPELQEKINQIKIPYIEQLHNFKDMPDGFKPWTCGLSPSELYSRSLPFRKKMGIKTPECKYISIKRWVSTTSSGIELPEGVFLSIKREENFITTPSPHFEKIEYILLMFKYGNVWSQQAPCVPITEEWMFSETEDGKTILEALMIKDALNPINGYWKAAYDQFIVEKSKEDRGEPTLLWIHMKRKRAAQSRQMNKLKDKNV